MSDQNQILRLLATLREESAQVRRRQEELYELLISYKDQIQDLKQTVVEKLAGLPKSPYIAGQLVPMPKKLEGVEDYRELLATYLHKAASGEVDPAERPVDTVYEPAPPIDPETIPLEEEEDSSDERPRRRGRGGRSGGSGGGPRDGDLERGPDRDVEPFDLNEDEEDDDEDEGEEEGAEGESGGGEDAGRSRGGRSRRRRRRGGRGRGRGDKAGTPGGESAG